MLLLLLHKNINLLAAMLDVVYQIFVLGRYWLRSSTDRLAILTLVMISFCLPIEMREQ